MNKEAENLDLNKIVKDYEVAEGMLLVAPDMESSSKLHLVEKKKKTIGKVLLSSSYLYKEGDIVLWGIDAFPNIVEIPFVQDGVNKSIALAVFSEKFILMKKKTISNL